jgi:outer membrane receptor protein involved in Fe transport
VNLGSEARAFFEASYVNRTSSQSLAPMPLVNSTIPTQPVTVSKDSIYNPFGIDIKSWRKRTAEFGERFFSQDLDTFRVVAGLDGSLGEWAGPLSGWAWNFDYNHGRTAGSQLNTGQLRMPNIANAVGPSAISPTTGKPVCLKTAATGNPAVDFASGNLIAGCVPLDVFHGVNPAANAAAKSYIAYDGTDFGTNQQDIFAVNFSGDLIKLAAERPVGLALGGDYRREMASFLNNPINSGESSGNNQLSTSGGYNVKELYGELVVPLLSGMPFVEDLELQAAARFNDFSTFGTNTTYKLGARWSPIRDLTARATWGTAFRAPNVAELFGGVADNYPRVKDPCNKPTDPTIKARCIATGVPGGNSQDPSTQLLSKQVANPGLGPETATTFTAGVVIQPQMVKNLSVTVDYYNVSVSKAINIRGAGFILDQCYRAAVQDQSMCDAILRNATGQVIQINDGSYLNSYRVTDVLGVITNGAGNFDMGALPKVKLNTGVFWTMAGFGLGVSGRYIGAYKECNDGGNGVCSVDDTQQRRVDWYLPIDVFASYTLKNWAAGTTALVVGVTNIGDVQPPFISVAFAANSDPSTYDYVGRFVYTRLTHNF